MGLLQPPSPCPAHRGSPLLSARQRVGQEGASDARPILDCSSLKPELQLRSDPAQQRAPSRSPWVQAHPQHRRVHGATDVALCKLSLCLQAGEEQSKTVARCASEQTFPGRAGTAEEK